MAIFYHGTSVLFDYFDISHLSEGDGKCKFGVGEYATSVYSTAALYAGEESNPTHYVYTIEVPDLTEDNHIFSVRPMNPGIVKRTEEHLGAIPDAVKSVGKLFRKYVGNLLIGNTGTVKRMSGSLSVEGEIAATKFFSSIGVLFLVWPNAQTAPDNGEINIAVLRDDVIRIVKIETVELDSKGKYVNGSNRTVKQYE